MAQDEAIRVSRKKPYTCVPQLISSHFSRKPFEPETTAHAVKAYEEAEREQLLQLIVRKRTAVGQPIDLVSAHREVDDLQSALRCGFAVTIF